MSLKILYFRIVLILLSISFLLAQNDSTSNSKQFNTNYLVNGEKYHTSSIDGMLYFHVNVWGHVKYPGRVSLVEGVDIITLLSAVGGPRNGANLNKVMLYREVPDKNNQSMYRININDFKAKGDRTGFVKILPNDTIIIEETKISYVIDRIGTLNTFMNLLNIYLNLYK